MTEQERGILSESQSFAELVGTLHALRFTGPITLHFLNGQPQTAELGRPVVVAFAEHPANKSRAGSQNPVDNRRAAPASSPP